MSTINEGAKIFIAGSDAIWQVSKVWTTGKLDIFYVNDPALRRSCHIRDITSLAYDSP